MENIIMAVKKYSFKKLALRRGFCASGIPYNPIPPEN